jgi:fatty-acyl-CoA synthase
VEVPLLLTDFLRRAVNVYGGKEAVVDGDLRMTYYQFNERVNRLANGLASLGVRKGDRVALLSPNSHRFLELFFAAHKLGAPLVPINYRLIADDFEYIVNHTESSVFMVDTELVDTVEGLRPRLSTIKHYVEMPFGTPRALNGWTAYEDVLAGASVAEPPDPGLGENDIATINYTSGTTARPKGVMCTHRNLYINAYNILAHINVFDSDNYMWTLPMFHANGWGFPYSLTGVGAKHVVLRKIDGKAIFDMIADEKITLACMAPAVLATVINYPDAAKHTLTTSPRLVCAGAPPPAAFIEQLHKRLGWEFVQVYGLTETSPFLTITKLKPGMEQLPESERYRILARAGVEMLGVELGVVDENEQEIPHDDDAIGEVVARSNVVLKGYWRQQEETDKAVYNGFFHSGDLATMDGEGYINIVDRKKDVIISGGENISSSEVEGALYKHPAVIECAVIGVPDEKWGETPKALVVLREGQTATEPELIAHCRDLLAHYKCPTSVDFVPSLPRTATGKLQKFVIREPYWKDQKRRVH